MHPFEDILGGSPEDNARAFRALLDGAEGAYRDAVLLNAAAALVIAGAASDLKDGVEQARQAEKRAKEGEKELRVAVDKDIQVYLIFLIFQYLPRRKGRYNEGFPIFLFFLSWSL